MFISECFKTRYILVPTAKLRLALWTKVLQLLTFNFKLEVNLFL